MINYTKSLNKGQHHSDTIQFKTYRNKFNKLKKIIKNKYYHDLLYEHRNNIKKTWEVLRNIIKKKNDKSNISDMFRVGTKTLEDPKEIANSFCKYFTNIGPELSKRIPAPHKTYEQYMKSDPPRNSLFFSPTDSNEIEAIIQIIKPKKSTGQDNLSSYLLKELRSAISTPLATIINKSMEQGFFPEQLKIAKIIPIYKSKEKDKFNNYRPISLLSSISKIYEKVIYKRIYTFVEPSLYANQFGFRSKRSTVHAVMELCTDIIESLEKKQITMATFLDLSKAFDTIDHNILINKLYMYGIRGIALDWFKSYLTHRKHFIQYKAHCSPMNFIETGVPQGSVLGPLLFIIYTNDLPKCLKNKNLKCLLFADDTTIYETNSEVTKLYDSLNDNLNVLADWFRANKLSLNVNKTVYMTFGNVKLHTLNNPASSLKLGEEIIKHVTVTQFLGIYIDENLKWTEHIKHVKSKLASSLYAMRSTKHTLTENHLKTLYFSLFQSYLEYGISIWGGANETVIKPLKIVQKKAIRIVSNSAYNAHTYPIFKHLHILKFTDLHDFDVLKFMFQYHHDGLPVSLNHLFTTNANIHQHNTRHRQDPHVVHRRTAFSNKALFKRVRNFGIPFRKV